MEIKQEKIKCFSKKHANIDAIIYCQNCRVYMCNKCKNLHSDLFEEHLLENDLSNIFTGICNEPNHNCELEYFCETHNLLCCSKCIGSFKNKGYGKHGQCKVYLIEDIKSNKKDKLNENINNLEQLNNDIEKKIEELRKIYDKMIEDKENVKLKLQKIYTKLRNIINKEEDKLLLKIDKKFDKNFFGEKFLKESSELPKRIQKILINGKSINKEWNENKLTYLVNECINIENNITKINDINNTINTYNTKTIKINYIEDEEKIKEFPQIVKNIGNLIIGKEFKYRFRECPKDFDKNKKYEILGKKQNIALKIGEKCWTPILCKYELKKNKLNVWNIKILEFDKCRSIVVGVVPSNFDYKNSSYLNCGWHLCLCCNGLFSGEPHNEKDKYLKLGFVNDITLIMDMQKGNLSCSINGKDEHILYEKIPMEQPLFPVVFLKNMNTKVIIDKISYKPISKQ